MTEQIEDNAGRRRGGRMRWPALLAVLGVAAMRYFGGSSGAEDYYAAGTKLLNEGKNREAVAQLDSTIALDSSMADAWVNRGVARSRMDDEKGAIVDYSEGIRLNPDDDIAYMDRAISWADLDEYDKALSDYARALAANPHAGKVYYHRAIDRRIHDELDAALRDLDSALANGVDDDGLHVQRGIVFAEMKRLDSAYAEYATALRRNPTSHRALYHRALDLAGEHKDSAALRDLDLAIHIAPDDSAAIRLRTKISARLEKRDVALGTDE
jgi:tetratricopeptide (TPR) repeat protein